MQQMPAIENIHVIEKNRTPFPVNHKNPDIEQMPTKNQKRQKFHSYETEDYLMVDTNYRKYLVKYDGLYFYEQMGKMQGRYGLIIELCNRSKISF